MKYIGYCDPETLPIKKGDRIRIKIGVKLHSFKRGHYEAKRQYYVTVDHVLPGTAEHEGYNGEIVPAKNPEVRWPGDGGYWTSADINEVEKVEG